MEGGGGEGGRDWSIFTYSHSRPLILSLSLGFAGAVASSITCPIEVVKTQLQSSRIGGGSNPFQVAREILAADGE